MIPLDGFASDVRRTDVVVEELLEPCGSVDDWSELILCGSDLSKV